MKSLFRKFHIFSERSKQYFSNCQNIIKAGNQTCLLYCTRIFFIVMLLYCIITSFLLPNPLLTGFYLIFLAADIALWIFAHRFNRIEEVSFSTVQKACILFVFLALGFTICISIFPFPDRPGIFYPIVYILISALFAFPYHQITLILNGISVVYLILAAVFKSPVAASYDYFACITACILTCFLLYIITKLRMQNGEAIQSLERLSRTDALTGLFNRRGAEDLMSRNFRRCQKQQLPVTAVMIDIDNFKKYNDTLGHPAGDTCLKSLSEILLTFAHDLGILAVRYGGEEFLLFLTDCSTDDAQSIAKKLLERLQNRAIPAPDGIVTASIGVAVQVPGTDNTLASLIKQADLALYQSKANGKNQATVVDLDHIEGNCVKKVTIRI